MRRDGSRIVVIAGLLIATSNGLAATEPRPEPKRLTSTVTVDAVYSPDGSWILAVHGCGVFARALAPRVMRVHQEGAAPCRWRACTLPSLLAGSRPSTSLMKSAASTSLSRSTPVSIPMPCSM